MWEDDTINYNQSSEPSSPRPSTVVTLPSSTLPANLISRPAAYTIGTKSRSYSNDPATPQAHLHHLPLRTHSHRKSTSVSSNASSTGTTGTTGTAGTAGTGLSSTSRVTFADQVAFPPGQEPDLALDGHSHFLEEEETHTIMASNPVPLSVATDVATSSPESPLSSSSTSTPHLTSPTLKRGLSRTSSLRSTPGSTPTTLPSSTATATVPGDAPLSSSLSRQSSLSLNLGRKSSMSKKSISTKSDRDSVPPSPSSAHRGQRHVMLNRRSVSQDFSLRLQQQQQKQDELGEELSEAGEDVPGTPSSVSSFGSASASTASGRNRLNRNSVALIESRNQTLSSNLAMVSSPTDSEFPQQTSESLLSVIAQKEARIAQLREDLETNLSELTQLKERWSQMMMEERTRQQAEASASIQQQEEKLYGHSSAHSVSHRLSTTGAGLWGSVVGSVSGISGVSGGISLHNINSIHHHHHHIPTDQEPVSQPKRSQSKGRTNRSDSQRAQSPSRPTSPLPAYLNGFSSLNGLDSPSSKGPTGSSTRGDRASVSSLSTCSSSLSNGDGPTAFEAGHSSQSSFSSAGGDHSQMSRERESRRTKRESSGLFIPPEAEEVLVNTGRALFKGFGSLIGGIRTVVNDVAESDRFQHSRQRTMDMVSGLAQTAADALPLPSHDDIYYHHQRLNLLDEEDEEGISPELLLQQQKIQLQHAKEQRRLERLKEKERRLQERNQSGDILDPAEPLAVDSSSARPAGTLVRRSSSRLKTKTMTGEGEVSLSRNVSQLSIHEVKKDLEETGGEWDSLEDKALMAALEETLAKKVEVPEADLLGLGLIDTPNSSFKKDD
ncbi:hypothetical protein BGZ82_004599 [Podila clonocystis]|nr:hypothetical protein BGZ82_004599 [Podila clonocystis]